MTTIRVISNGFGEDAIACQLIKAYLDTVADDAFVLFNVFPCVGEGAAYKKIGLTPNLSQQVLPSGGFLHRMADVIKDLRSGLFSSVRRQRRAILDCSADMQWVIGDVYALWMASVGRSIPTVFFPTAKSERAIPHYALERRYIRAHANLVFPRDVETHQSFVAHGIPSQFLGNPMFDGLISNQEPPSGTVCGILPGSRGEALANIGTILDIIAGLDTQKVDTFLMALVPSITYADLLQVVEARPWRVERKDSDLVLVYTQKKVEVVVSRNFNDVLHASSLVLGLAGTANEQALFAGRPLISFIGAGAQSTLKRFKQQHQLIDGAKAILVPSSNAGEVSKRLAHILDTNDFPWQPLPPAQAVAKDIVPLIHTVH
jgi:uncharacterized protein (TIGR03492 family)